MRDTIAADSLYAPPFDSICSLWNGPLSPFAVCHPFSSLLPFSPFYSDYLNLIQIPWQTDAAHMLLPVTKMLLWGQRIWVPWNRCREELLTWRARSQAWDVVLPPHISCQESETISWKVAISNLIEDDGCVMITSTHMFVWRSLVHILLWA
jgi:hypothetical protein